MTIATFQTPNEEVLNLIADGKKVQACKAWRNQEHKLLDGTRVKPTLSCCMNMIRAVEAGVWRVPLAIPTDGYVTV